MPNRLILEKSNCLYDNLHLKIECPPAILSLHRIRPNRNTRPLLDIQLKKQVFALLLLNCVLPAFACTVSQVPGTITLHVGDSACLDDPKKLNNFAASLKRAIVQSERPTPSKSSRATREEKLRNIDEMAHRERFLSAQSKSSPSYYGQR
jgi:hypothetical protein